MYDFPTAPTLGQVFGNYTWDGEKWNLSLTISLATAAEYIANTSNRMLSPNCVWAAVSGIVTLTETAAAVTPDFSIGIDFYWPMGGAGRTINNPTNIKVGQKGTITFASGSAGTITTWGGFYKFPASIKPFLTPNGVDVIFYYAMNATTILCTAGLDFR